MGSDWVTRDNRDTSGLVLTGEKIEIMSSLLPSDGVVQWSTLVSFAVDYS